MRPILVTGGAGFIGSAVVRNLVLEAGLPVVTVDSLTYAGNLDSLRQVASHPLHAFECVDIVDRDALRAVFERHRPRAVLHLAAESHVDRSIDAPAAFVRTNLLGTFTLLEEARRHWLTLDSADRRAFRFVDVSTDEVFGSAEPDGRFDATSAYRPGSPYAATKAGGDHLAASWWRTYGLPVLVTHGSNSYGPYQFPEKLIPLAILNGLEGRPIRVYGDGAQVRDWIHVDDHVAGLIGVLEAGEPGAGYVIAAGSERRNIDVVHGICALLDQLRPDAAPHAALIEHVEDRPGHDRRYALDASRVRAELRWEPAVSFEAGLRRTVEWYLENRWWWERVRSGAYRGERLGLGVGVEP